METYIGAGGLLRHIGGPIEACWRPMETYIGAMEACWWPTETQSGPMEAH